MCGSTVVTINVSGFKIFGKWFYISQYSVACLSDAPLHMNCTHIVQLNQILTARYYSIVWI